MPVAPGAVYRFDRFVLDLGRGVLMEQGVERQLRPKTFTLLEYFVQNAGRVVGRDEIMQVIWPDVIVTDDSIAQCIKEVRRTLGDDRHQLLRTVPRRGYQFVGPVDIYPAQTVAPSPPPSATDTTLEQSSRATTAADAPVLPDKPSIAVLPFANLSADTNQSYFSDGVTHDIITELSRFSELLVIASNSSFQYRDRFPDMRQVGRELGIRYALGGSIRRAGSRVRITAELVDTATGAHLWAERYDRELEDVFAVEDEVVRRSWRSSPRMSARPKSSARAPSHRGVCRPTITICRPRQPSPTSCHPSRSRISTRRGVFSIKHLPSIQVMACAGHSWPRPVCRPS